MAEGNQHADSESSNKLAEQNDAGPPKESLEDLLTTLSNQIRSSDWLVQNTPEKFASENPEVAQAFKDAAEKSSAAKQNTGDQG